MNKPIDWTRSLEKAVDDASPLFSVIIPTYNRAEMVGDSIRSVLAQSFTDFELVIVDDGSTDETRLAVATFHDERIRYFYKENGERGAARNFGVRASRGSYVCFIDSDDVAYPFALERARILVDELKSPPCFAQRYEVKEKLSGRPTVPPPTVAGRLANESLKSSNVLGCMGVFMKRELAISLPFEEDRQFAGSEDWLMWLKLGARFPIPYSQEICYCYFQHDSRSVMSFSEEKLRYRAEYMRKYLLADSPSVAAYGRKTIDRIYAHMLTYAALHLAMSRRRAQAVQYLLKGIKVNFAEVFQRRTLGIFKTIVLGS